MQPVTVPLAAGVLFEVCLISPLSKVARHGSIVGLEGCAVMANLLAVPPDFQPQPLLQEQ